MFEIIADLKRRGTIKPEVLSLNDGPLRASYEAEGIPVRILRFHRKFGSLGEYHALLADWTQKANLPSYQLVYANTIDAFFAIDAAHKKNIASIWSIHESLKVDRLFTHLPASIRKRAYACFQWPYRVVFVAESTKRGYGVLETRANFEVITNALNTEPISQNKMEDKSIAKKAISIAETKKVILSVGTICARKAQLDLVRAFEKLPTELIDNCNLLLVGGSVGKYGKTTTNIIEGNPLLKRNVHLIGTTEDPYPYYQAADIYACSSKNESYPLTILEAMLFGLPIVTTPTFGIREQVREGFNAHFYNYGDIEGLTEALIQMLENDDERQRMGEKSRLMLQSLNTFSEMIDRYDETFYVASSS